MASQLIGLAMARYVLELPPLAGAGTEEVVRLVAPTIQRYLTGELEPAEETIPPVENTIAALRETRRGATTGSSSIRETIEENRR